MNTLIGLFIGFASALLVANQHGSAWDDANDNPEIHFENHRAPDGEKIKVRTGEATDVLQSEFEVTYNDASKETITSHSYRFTEDTCRRLLHHPRVRQVRLRSQKEKIGLNGEPGWTPFKKLVRNKDVECDYSDMPGGIYRKP